MHLVEAPQERPFMVGAVPPVDPQMEQQDVERQPRPGRPAHQFRRLHGACSAAPIVTGRTNRVDSAPLRMKKPRLRPAREPGRTIAGQMDGRRGGGPAIARPPAPAPIFHPATIAPLAPAGPATEDLHGIGIWRESGFRKNVRGFARYLELRRLRSRRARAVLDSTQLLNDPAGVRTRSQR